MSQSPPSDLDSRSRQMMALLAHIRASGYRVQHARMDGLEVSLVDMALPLEPGTPGEIDEEAPAVSLVGRSIYQEYGADLIERGLKGGEDE